MKDKKALAIHGPLSALGVVAGLLAAGTIMPTSCEFTEQQSDRLHLVLPVAMPLSWLLAVTWFARYLAPRPGNESRRWIWLTLAMTLTSEVLFNFAAGPAYDPKELLNSSAASWAFFWPLLVGLIPIVFLVVARAREVAGIRPLSLAFGVARRQVWLVVLAGIAPLETLFYQLHRSPVWTSAYVVWVLGALAIPVLAGFLMADWRAASRLECVLAGSRVCEPDEALAENASLADLGIGDELSVPPFADATYRYRASAELTAAVRGNPDMARRLITDAWRLTAIALALAILGSIAAGLTLADLPPWRPVDDTPLAIPGLGGC